MKVESSNYELDPAAEKLLWAQAIASQYSVSTRQRWRARVDSKKYLGATESAYYRRALAYSLYLREEIERCAAANAHFAVGLLSMSLMETLLVMYFLGRKEEVLATSTFAKQCEQCRKTKKRIPSFLKLISTMKAEALYRLTREMKVLEIDDISPDCLIFVREARYSADIASILRYLQDCRNTVHFEKFAARVERMVPDHVVDPRNPLSDYYYRFAFVAIRIRNLISKQPSGNGLLIRPF